MGHLCPADPGQVCFQFITKRSEAPGGWWAGVRGGGLSVLSPLGGLLSEAGGAFPPAPGPTRGGALVIYTAQG